MVDRQLKLRQLQAQPQYPPTVCELVDTLLHGADTDQTVGSLLQLAADDFLRGAVLMVEETAIRCRAASQPRDRCRISPYSSILWEGVTLVWQS